MGGFLLDTYSFPMLIKFHDTEPLRIIHVVTEDRRAVSVLRVLRSSSQSLLESVSGKNIVAEHHSHGISVNKFLSDHKCLGKSVRAGLCFIGKMNAELVPVS